MAHNYTLGLKDILVSNLDIFIKFQFGLKSINYFKYITALLNKDLKEEKAHSDAF